MHSLAQEIQGFSKSRLKKQSTCVTTATGQRLRESRDEAGEEHVEPLDQGCGIVLDHSLDLQVGVVRPFLLLASQDAAHDMETLTTHQFCYGAAFHQQGQERVDVKVDGTKYRTFLDKKLGRNYYYYSRVTHVLNVAYGVSNAFPKKLVYKTLPILDIPETNITAYLEECSSFIDQARDQNGIVLVHCNAGVSRSVSVVIGYLMAREGLPFSEAHCQVLAARPSARPNTGFYHQLLHYVP